NALEFTFHRTRRSNILHLPDEQFEMLRQKVSTCMTLLLSHFDILGARSNVEAKREKERMEELLRQKTLDDGLSDYKDSQSLPPEQEEMVSNFGPYPHTDASALIFWERACRSFAEIENRRNVIQHRQLGRVLDDEKLEDRTLVFLANSSSNISIRW